MDLTVEELNRLLEYNNGELYWKARASKCVKIGDIVTGIGGAGYKRVTINYKSYFAHRIIFFIHHGYIPAYIDHINGDKTDNRIENLRQCTVSQNGHNSKIRKDNTSGIKGVSWLKRERRWRVRIESEGKVVAEKYFIDFDKAKLYAHKTRSLNHGDFTRHI